MSKDDHKIDADDRSVFQVLNPSYSPPNAFVTDEVR
jgi:hypothetical protein